MKSTKKALLLSIASMLLCVAMLMGTTFAWFTDSVTSGKNRIVAGNLDVELYHSNANVQNQKVQNETNLFCDKDGKQIKWEPGVISYENFTVKNEGTLALKFNLVLDVWNHNTYNERDLSEIIKVSVIMNGSFSGNREDAIALDYDGIDTFRLKDEHLLPEGEKNFAIVLYWEPGENDNLYNVNNGQSTSDGDSLFIEFGINLTATQDTVEKDSFDKLYDEFAMYDIPDDYFTYDSEDGSVLTGLSQKGKNAKVDKLAIPSGITKIAEGAFKDNKDLEIVAFEGAIEIEKGAFADCSGIKTLIFGDDTNVKLGDDVFFRCNNIEHVYGNGSTLDLGAQSIVNTGNQKEIVYEDCNIIADEPHGITYEGVGNFVHYEKCSIKVTGGDDSAITNAIYISGVKNTVIFNDCELIVTNQAGKQPAAIIESSTRLENSAVVLDDDTVLSLDENGSYLIYATGGDISDIVVYVKDGNGEGINCGVVNNFAGRVSVKFKDNANFNPADWVYTGEIPADPSTDPEEQEETQVETFEEIFQAIEGEEPFNYNIELTKDETLIKDLEIPAGSSATIDLGGKTMTLAGSLSSAGGKLTVTNGKIVVESQLAFGIDVYNAAGHVIIKDVDITVTGMNASGVAIYDANGSTKTIVDMQNVDFHLKNNSYGVMIIAGNNKGLDILMDSACSFEKETGCNEIFVNNISGGVSVNLYVPGGNSPQIGYAPAYGSGNFYVKDISDYEAPTPVNPPVTPPVNPPSQDEDEPGTVTASDESSVKTALSSGNPVKLSGDVTMNVTGADISRANINLNGQTLSISGVTISSASTTDIKIHGGTVNLTSGGFGVYAGKISFSDCTIVVENGATITEAIASTTISFNNVVFDCRSESPTLWLGNGDTLTLTNCSKAAGSKDIFAYQGNVFGKSISVNGSTVTLPEGGGTISLPVAE